MKYVAYCRKSTEAEDRQVLSIDSQESELKRLAERDGFTITKVFKESKSAKSSGRPIFGEVLRYIQKSGECILLVWKPDRIARNMVDGGLVIELMDKGFIKEIRTPEKSFRNSSDDKFMMTLDFGIAKKYVDDLSANVKRGNRAKLERGGWPNHAPFGYVNEKATKTLYLDEKVAPFIPRIFELYAKGGRGLQEIVNTMYAEGLRSRSGTKVRKGHIHRIIRDPFYMGVMFRNGKYYQGNHTPLISKELYDTANAVLDGKQHGRQQKRFFHLRGFLKCAKCGCAITASKRKGHDYYFCTNGKRVCDQHHVYMRSEYLDGIIGEKLGKLQCDTELVELAYRAAKERLAHENHYASSSVETLEKRLQQIETAQSKLADSFAAEITPEAIYTPKMKALANEMVAVKAEIKKMKNKADDQFSTLEPVKNHFLQGISARNDYLEAEPEEKRILLQELLWNLSLNNRIVQDLQYKPVYALIAKEPKPTDFETMLRGQDSDLLRELMGLPGKPFPTLPRRGARRAVRT
ncbi:MAG TPA: recombinase family protein [Candidatus Paceibacterota bacterium]|nr:recombinase family protein [Candidatus Paceibacterota bacterium]